MLLQGSIDISHENNGFMYKDEGVIQQTTISLSRNISEFETVFVHMWAENNVSDISIYTSNFVLCFYTTKLFRPPSHTIHAILKQVGLLSDLAHSAFEANPSGSLELVRRCLGHTCEGACICAAQHKRCQPTGQTCRNRTSGEAGLESRTTAPSFLFSLFLCCMFILPFSLLFLC